eukprot:76787_1
MASLFVLYHLLFGFYCSTSRGPSPPSADATLSDIDITPNKSDLSPETIDREQSKPELQFIQVFFKRSTVAVCTSWSVVCIASAMDRISLSSNPDRSSDPYQFMVFPFYFIGRILLSLIFIGRLHYTFHGSPFQSTRCTMNALKCTWLMMVFSAISAIALCSSS